MPWAWIVEEDKPVIADFKMKALGAVLVCLMLSEGARAGPQQNQQKQPLVPDAPVPQNPTPLSDLTGPITPGIGAGTGLNTASDSSSD
jgi:hypothetical protein